MRKLLLIALAVLALAGCQKEEAEKLPWDGYDQEKLCKPLLGWWATEKFEYWEDTGIWCTTIINFREYGSAVQIRIFDNLPSNLPINDMEISSFDYTLTNSSIYTYYLYDSRLIKHNYQIVYEQLRTEGGSIYSREILILDDVKYYRRTPVEINP